MLASGRLSPGRTGDSAGVVGDHASHSGHTPAPGSRHTAPPSLQQHAVCPGLLLVGVQQLVGSGGGVSGSLLFPSLELLVDPLCLLDAGASDTLLHLAPAERDVSCYLWFLRDASASAASLPWTLTSLGIQLILALRLCAKRNCRLPRMVVTRPTLSLGWHC